LRTLLIIAGIALAAVGGVVAYRAAFLAPPAALLVNESSGSVHQVQNVWGIAGGVALLALGAWLAFFAARRRP
jgi:hypothetical protein